MLNSRIPEVTKVGKYIEKFSDKRTQPAYTIGNAERFGSTLKRSHSLPGAGKLGPGQYRVDRDFPENELYEHPVYFNTKCVQPAPKYSFTLDERIARDGCVKGLSQFYQKTPLMLGPGHYGVPAQPYRKKQITHFIPKAKETQEAIRERKIFSTSPGPGVYDMTTKFDAIDKDKTKIIKSLVKTHGKESWAAPQFSHMFNSLKLKPKPCAASHEKVSVSKAAQKTDAAPAKDAEAS
jgi:hypothetical protein